MTNFDSQAAVVGASVVAFAAGLPATHREDVYMITAYAQQATRAAVNDGLSGSWFDYYRKQLQFLGWDVPKPQRLSPLADDALGSQGARQIQLKLGESYASPMRSALGAMERDAQAIALFDDIAYTAEAGVFQMIPCVMDGPNKVVLGLYHREFRVSRRGSGFLFGKGAAQVHDSIEQIASVTLNLLLYGDYRERVKKSVLNQSLKYITNLHL